MMLDCFCNHDHDNEFVTLFYNMQSTLFHFILFIIISNKNFEIVKATLSNLLPTLL